MTEIRGVAKHDRVHLPVMEEGWEGVWPVPSV